MKPVSDQSNEEWLADYEKPMKKNAAVQQTNTSNPQASVTQLNPGPAQGTTRKNQIAPKIVLPDNLPTVIPECNYKARCYDFTFGEYWGESKLIVKFEITIGLYANTRLECFFNLDKKKNTAGEFVMVPKKRSLYLRAMSKMFAKVKAAGGDWLSPENLLGKLFNIEVITVTKDHAKETLGCNQYSKVKPNIELINENKQT